MISKLVFRLKKISYEIGRRGSSNDGTLWLHDDNDVSVFLDNNVFVHPVLNTHETERHSTEQIVKFENQK